MAALIERMERQGCNSRGKAQVSRREGQKIMISASELGAEVFAFLCIESAWRFALPDFRGSPLFPRSPTAPQSHIRAPLMVIDKSEFLEYIVLK